MEDRVDVDVVACLGTGEEGADLVRDGVIGVQDGADGERDGLVCAPVDAEFDLGCGAGGRVGDLEPGEARAFRCCGDVESVALVGGDHRGERLRELLLGC